MEQCKARELKEKLSIVSDDLWSMWVDEELWGYTTSVNDSKWFLEKISSEIVKDIKREHPQWTVDSEQVDEQTCKIKCLHPGYVYNSRWTAHTVRYEAGSKLRDDVPRRKRAPSFGKIRDDYLSANPVTRQPTPRATASVNGNVTIPAASEITPPLTITDVPPAPPLPDSFYSTAQIVKRKKYRKRK